MAAPPILIMTATITPPADAFNLAHTDPAKRLADYELALHFYLDALAKGSISGIVFAENSSSDISSLRRKGDDSGLGQKVEFVEFAGLDHPGAFGRAYGEFKLLDHVMNRSVLIQAAAPSASIWKVTGRYRVVNLDRILPASGPECDLWVNCRNHPMRWADMYFFGWRRAFYAAHIENLYLQLDESKLSTAPEVAFRAFLDEIAKAQPVARRIRPTPDIEGTRGLDGAVYSERRAKALARKAADKIAPWLWI